MKILEKEDFLVKYLLNIITICKISQIRSWKNCKNIINISNILELSIFFFYMPQICDRISELFSNDLFVYHLAMLLCICLFNFAITDTKPVT